MNKKGFTLIEVLAVIVILGLLVGIAVPSVLSIQRKNRINFYKEKLNQVENAAKLWGQDNMIALQNITSQNLSFCDSIDDKYCVIKIQYLIDKDYIKTDATDDDGKKFLQDPRNGQSMNCDLVRVKVKNKKIIVHAENYTDVIRVSNCNIGEKQYKLTINYNNNVTPVTYLMNSGETKDNISSQSKQYSVRFDGNGGTVVEKLSQSSSINSWQMSPKNSGSSIVKENSKYVFKMGHQNTTITAVWGNTSEQVTCPNATKPLSYLEGWYTNAGIRLCGAGDKIVVNSNMKLTAKWISSEYIARPVADCHNQKISIDISKQLFNTSSNVVLVQYPEDGYSAVGLAGDLNAPVLFDYVDSPTDTPNSSTIHQEIYDEINRLKASTVYLISGCGSSDQNCNNLEQNIKTKTKTTVVKLFGYDRFETSYNVAKKIKKEHVVVTGLGETLNNYYDVAMMSFATAKNGWPLLVTDNLGRYGNSSPETDHIKNNRTFANSVTGNIFVGGGENGSTLPSYLKDYNSSKIKRYGGETVFDTNYLINKNLQPKFTSIMLVEGSRSDYDYGWEAFYLSQYAKQKNAALFIMDNGILTKNQCNLIANNVVSRIYYADGSCNNNPGGLNTAKKAMQSCGF